jgi:hypothetical protein
VVSSFRGTLSANVFAKRYELHYKPKWMEIDGGVVQAQFGCLDFYTKRYRGGGVRLTLAVKNKWSAGWTGA